MKKNSLKQAASVAFLFILLPILPSAGAIYQVTTTTYTGPGSISQAVASANASAGKDTIYFSIPGAAPFVISMNPELLLNGDVLIDGTSQAGYNPAAPKPVIELRNSPAMAFIVVGGASDIRALGINNCAMGIVYQTPNNRITGCYIGLGLDGVTDSGNNGHGITINASSNGNKIGGITAAERNIISGNNNGHAIIVTSSTNNYIIGNYLGTNATGTAAVANTFMGIQMDNSSNNTIGGASVDSSNLISGNGQSGIQIIGGASNRILGNTISGNGQNGIAIIGGSFNRILGNTISDNVENGIVIIGGSTSNQILGNTIGLQADKSSALGNKGHGIYIGNSNSTQIGGVGTLAGNIISSNNGIGINVNNSKFTSIKSNIIGTSQNTQLARGNLQNNIQLINSRETIIGGDHLTEGNIISASGGAGINFEGAGSNKCIIKGNYIGTDNTGTLALGNNGIGIILKADSCTIGGTMAGEGNIIVDSKSSQGILIANANANIVKGNQIGIGVDGITAIPNKTDGITIAVELGGISSSNNVIQFNVIAYNLRNGINVGQDAFGNFINANERNNDLRFNSIFCNVKLGISLELTNPADQGNNGKIAPLINNALSTSSKVVGLANGLAPTDSIDIYEMSACVSCDLNPQGKKYIATVVPDAAGNWSYDQGTPIAGTLIATATDANRNTSQFSLCYTPCSALAVLDPTNVTIQLEKNNVVPITLTSSSTFSNLTPIPGQTFWSLGSPDTTGAALLSTANSISFNFAAGGSAGSTGPGLYHIYFIAKQSGCIDTAEATLNIFFIPNMITPNGDHMNDEWSVGNAPGLFDAKIYNRWGELVYTKTDYTNEWTGAGLGEGVYYYLLEDKTQDKKSFKGWIQVLK